MEGVLPPMLLATAEGAFGFSDRALSARTIGLESLGRFRPVPFKAASGVTCNFYSVSAVTGNKVFDYAAIAHPAMAPVWGVREHTVNEDGTRNWGSWRLCDPPSDLRGFSSVPASPVSDKQKAWWQRSAKTRGIDDSATPDRKVFGVLPFLFDTGTRLK